MNDPTTIYFRNRSDVQTFDWGDLICAMIEAGEDNYTVKLFGEDHTYLLAIIVDGIVYVVEEYTENHE